jgi:long-chain fatty acid transport protein
MGGVGVAVPGDVLAALRHNPALLAELPDHRFAMSALMLKGDNEVRSRVGPFGGRTENDTDAFLIPAFGWSRRAEERPYAVGLGFLGVAGFASDFPQDPSNPVLALEPQGFGHLISRYDLLQLPLAVAFRVNDRLSLGGSLILGYATLQAGPFGGIAPDCSGPTACFFPRLDEDQAFGIGAQVGVYYQASERVSLGASYSTPQVFEDFSWNTTVANPNLPTFGTHRRVRFNVDVPQIFAVGVGFTPGERWKVGLDGRFINYEDTDGFDSGFDLATFAARGLGWEDITVVAVGAQYRYGEKATVRFGFNRSDSAVPAENSFINVGSPAQFEETASVGVGIPVYPNLHLDLSYYHVFNTEQSGSFQTPFGPIPGTSVTNEIGADAVVVTLSFEL